MIQSCAACPLFLIQVISISLSLVVVDLNCCAIVVRSHLRDRLWREYITLVALLLGCIPLFLGLFNGTLWRQLKLFSILACRCTVMLRLLLACCGHIAALGNILRAQDIRAADWWVATRGASRSHVRLGWYSVLLLVVHRW